MENIPFVIWMLGYPVTCSIGEYVFYVSRKQTATEGAVLLSVAIKLLVWFLVGRLLYHP